MYVQIDAERLKQLVAESANYHALRTAGVDNWEWYEETNWPTDADINVLYEDAVRDSRHSNPPQEPVFVWHGIPPQEPVAQALLRYVDGDPRYLYILGRWDSDGNAVWFYDELHKCSINFAPGDEWIELESGITNDV